MRTFILSACFLFWISITEGLQCWECENVKSQEECLEKGRMVTCEENQDTCQIELRHGGWGDYPLIEKACKQVSACGSNHMQDAGRASVYLKDTQCNKRAPSSVCRCCCSTDGCNHHILFCDELGGLPCPPVYAPEHGYMKCTNDMMPFSVCFFYCKRGYSVVGAAKSTCDVFSKRDNPQPSCRRVVCRPVNSVRFGSVSCSDENNVYSVCRFSCNQGYRLHGASAVRCFEDRDTDMWGLWSRPIPQCKPLQCKLQSITNGRMRCTDKNLVGSTCSFECNTGRGYVLHPPATLENTCQVTELWNRPAPCCTLPCPPFAKMDFIVVLDSSSSVGAENWILMKEFVKSFLDDFTVREDSAHFGVIRYNKAVDTETQILLDDYPNSIQSVLEAFDKIPYNGSGTRTGNALNYTATTMIQRGNRPDARDVVLLITDGASQDDVKVPGQILRDTGALVFVLPVKPPVGRLNITQVEWITGNKENVIRDALDKGFAALDAEFSRKMSSILCGEPCT